MSTLLRRAGSMAAEVAKAQERGKSGNELETIRSEGKSYSLGRLLFFTDQPKPAAELSRTSNSALCPLRTFNSMVYAIIVMTPFPEHGAQIRQT